MTAEAEAREAAYLMTPEAIRERSEAVYRLGLDGELEGWRVDEDRLASVADLVVAETRKTYPDVRAIPYHSRWRHFSAGDVDRAAEFERRIAGFSVEERLASRFELAITSVLLDAGAGQTWTFHESGGAAYSRSEGLAVASYHLFSEGGLADDASRRPFRADAGKLQNVDARALATAFQVRADNPLVGLDGRADLLRRLGARVASAPEFFGAETPRLGNLGVELLKRANGGEVRARDILTTVLDALGPIWPSRARLADRALGDVWRHSRVGWVPFHKLSQWLTYSLVEPLEAEGAKVSGLGALTGLAEYRNGGLFVDGGVLSLRDARAADQEHEVSSDLVVEWRALTVALLDRVASLVRRTLGLSIAELPLAKVLEGGTWQTGRRLAFERRPGGTPPLRIRSDGTVF